MESEQLGGIDSIDLRVRVNEGERGRDRCPRGWVHTAGAQGVAIGAVGRKGGRDHGRLFWLGLRFPARLKQRVERGVQPKGAGGLQSQ